MSTTPSTPPSRLEALVFAFASVAAALLLFGLQPLGSMMYWWHIAIGELISTWQQIPDEQLFLYTVAPDHPWVYDAWLGAVVLDVFDHLAGPELNLLFRNIALALSVGLLAFFLALRHRRRGPVVAALVVACGLMWWFIDVEPAVLAAPVATAAVLLGFFALETPRRHFGWTAAIPVATFAVVNFDFAIGLALMVVGLALSATLIRRAADTDRKRPFVIGAVLAAASLTGIFGFAYGPGYLSELALAVVSAPDIPTLVAVAATAVATIGLVWIADARPDSTWPKPFCTLVTAATAAVALIAPSTIIVFGVVVALVFAEYLQGLSLWSDVGLPSTTKMIVFGLLTATVAIAVQPGVPTRTPVMTTLYDDVRTTPPLAGTMDNALPVRCVEELRRAGSQLRVFHEPQLAGFLLVHLFDAERPHALLFDDHRDLVDDETRSRAAVFEDARGIRGLFEEYDVDAAILDRQTHTAASGELDDAPGWHDLRIDRDERFGCFVRTGQ